MPMPFQLHETRAPSSAQGPFAPRPKVPTRKPSLPLACAAALVASLGLGGCATTHNSSSPNLLEDARDAYARASKAPEAEGRPELERAKQRLAEAEQAQAERPGSAEAAHLAESALQHSQLAIVRGERDALREALRETRKRLELAEANDNANNDREAAVRALVALDEHLVVIEEEESRIIRLPARDLFKDVDESGLSDTGKQLLTEVAAVMQKQMICQPFHIQGLTHTRGPKRYNQAIAHARAKAVRDFLTDHGVNAWQLSVEAGSESGPVTSPDKDAQGPVAQRVEIIIPKLPSRPVGVLGELTVSVQSDDPANMPESPEPATVATNAPVPKDARRAPTQAAGQEAQRNSKQR